jgi:hypothetical protein
MVGEGIAVLIFFSTRASGDRNAETRCAGRGVEQNVARLAYGSIRILYG